MGEKTPFSVTPNFAYLFGLPFGSAGEETACNAGDLVSIPRLRRSLGEGKGYPLQYSGLENSMDSIAHGITNSCTRLSEFHFHYLFIYVLQHVGS